MAADTYTMGSYTMGFNTTGGTAGEIAGRGGRDRGRKCERGVEGIRRFYLQSSRDLRRALPSTRRIPVELSSCAALPRSASQSRSWPWTER